MTVDTLKQLIDTCHANGKKAALCSCSLVPVEILTAAGIVPIRVLHVSDPVDAAGRILYNNTCSVVKEFCNLYEDPRVAHADLIMAETSCDGKKKMHELLSNQERMIYYQVPQGTDRSYVKKLLISECRYLIRTLEKKFNLTITEEALRNAAADANAERDALADLMAVQKGTPAAATGKEIYEWIQEAGLLLSAKERADFYHAKREEVQKREAPAKADGARILVTGCPISSVYGKIMDAIEQNGGVVACVENCETMKPANMHVDTETADIVEAIAVCYQNSTCAIMDYNVKRFNLLRRLSEEYKIDGIVDVEMAVCHSYTIEKYKTGRFCKEEMHMPYLSVETDNTSGDVGQMATRLSAFIEML